MGLECKPLEKECIRIMTYEKYAYLIIFVFLFFSQDIIPQENEELVLLKVNHISSNAFYKETFTVNVPLQTHRGSKYSLPAQRKQTFHRFEFSVSIIVREKGNVANLPLCVRLISPKN